MEGININNNKKRKNIQLSEVVEGKGDGVKNDVQVYGFRVWEDNDGTE